MEFPTIVYRCPGEHQRPGGTFSYRPAQDAEQFAAALVEGWFATLPEAIEGRRADSHLGEIEPPIDNEPPTRAELEQKAVELGIKFDGRTRDTKLGALIAEALAIKG